MFVCALTGGIAAGKTIVSRRLAERGAAHIDADALAREVVEPGTPGLAAVEARFGREVIAPDGSLDRAALGAVVFVDPEARRALEGITHPAVQALSEHRMREAVAGDPGRVVVYDVPLLVEARGTAGFDLVVVVDAPREMRLRRLVEQRGMSPVDAARRIDAQVADDARLAVADVVVDSSGSLEHTLEQADRLYDHLRSLSAAKQAGLRGPTVGGAS